MKRSERAVQLHRPFPVICTSILQDLHPLRIFVAFLLPFCYNDASACRIGIIFRNERRRTAFMHIMLTNDDGIFAAGIQALALELEERGGHRVTIVAPDSERSGAGHSFTFLTPLRANRITLSGLEEVEAYAVNGTPTDCVKVGLGNLAQRPDCILSGINHGQNLGVDTTYSGTVSAAMEGALLGVPSMAVSLVGMKSEDFGPAAWVARELLPAFFKSGSPLWNVNVPALPRQNLRGVRFTPLAHQIYDGRYIEREDPHGRKYYWTPPGATYQCGPKEECDVRWVQDGYVTVTPLLTDFTDQAALARLQNAEKPRIFGMEG